MSTAKRYHGSAEPVPLTLSYFFNVKYDHYGPIYLDRFKSNPVETKDYFLKVLDHIGSQQTETKYTCRHLPSGLKVSNSQILDQEPKLLDFKERAKRITIPSPTSASSSSVQKKHRKKQSEIARKKAVPSVRSSA